MSEIIKQSMSNIWASAGDIVAPDSVKIADGWLVEVVPRQYWNWMQNRTDVNLAYMLQHGIPEWDATTEFIANKSYVQYADVVYKAILTGTNKIPSSQPTYWKVAFATSTAALEALKATTPAVDKLPYFNGTTTATTTTLTSFARTILDDTSASAVRTTIGAQAQDATLQAISDLTTATNKLAYFTGVDTAATTDLTAFGRSLIDDADAVAGRTTLGLGTVSTANITTSSTDSTANRVTKVGDFGTGARIAPAGGDLNTLLLGGMYNYDSTASGLNGPSGMTYGSVLVLPFSMNGCQQVFTTYGVNPRTFIRNLHTSSTTWTDWFETWTTNNFAPTDYLLKTGGQLTGALTINAPASQLTLKSTSDGVAATAYVSFYQSGGARDGYVGVQSPSTTNFYVQADTGDILLYPSTAAKAVIAYCGAAEKFRTKATGVTVTGECLATTFVGDGSGLTNLNAADISAGTLPVVRGGTGVTTSTGTGSVVLSASPTLTGVPLAPTAAQNTNTTQLATTAFVLNQANDTAANILMDGTQSAGTLETYARSNHRHPTDTSRAPVASPAFTGAATFSGTVVYQGFTDGSEAASGKVGQVITAERTVALSLATNTPVNITSIALTAGDWEVRGVVKYGGTASNSSYKAVGISSTSATLDEKLTVTVTPGTNTSLINDSLPAANERFNVTSTTTVYLVTAAGFSGGTQTVVGSILARRVR